jgi:hypothetical protein
VVQTGASSHTLPNNQCQRHPSFSSIPQLRCERCCCIRRQVLLKIAWAKTIPSVQGHNAGPTGQNQSPNAIQAIVRDLGARNCETLNPGMSYVATSRATTIGDCGTRQVIPRKCTNSVIYFKAGTFPTGLKCLTHSDKGVEYNRVQERTAWVSYLDRQQEQTSTVDDEYEKWRSNNGWRMENIQEINCYLLYAVNLGDRTDHSNFPKNSNCLYTKTEEHSAISHSKLSHILITSRN